MKISVENGGKLLYLPQPVIPFAESIFDSRTEIFLDSGSQFVMQDIFSFHQQGLDAAGKIVGSFKPTGSIPTWYEQLPERGISLDPGIFDPENSSDVDMVFLKGKKQC